MKKILIVMIMITSLSNGQTTRKSSLNHQNNFTLNESFSILNQSNISENPIPFDEFELNLDNLDVTNQNTTAVYSSKNEEYTIRLDSSSNVIINQDGISRKEERAYDENGNRTLRINYNWDTQTAAFVPSSKYEYGYDENGNQTLSIYYRVDTQTTTFVPSGKTEYIRDENGRTTLYINYNWDTQTTTFVPSGKTEYIRDENGTTTLYIYYIWDAQTTAFVPSSKEEYGYDENGNLTLSINYSWDTQTAAFVPNSKREYGYDENGRTTLYIYYNWDTQTTTFVPSGKTEYGYDENGQTVKDDSFNWNSVIGVFLPIVKIEFEFDEQMRIVSKNYYDIDICNETAVLNRREEYSYIDGLDGREFSLYNTDENGISIFQYGNENYYENGRLVLRSQTVNPEIYDPEILNWKIEYEYDENGNLKLLTSYKWDTQTDNLILSYKKESSYDDDNKIKQELFSLWYNGLGIFKPSIKKEYDVIIDTDTERVEEALLFTYDTDFNQWNALEDVKYNSYWYYTKTSTLSSSNFNKNTTLVFPNPTSKFLKIILSEELYEPILEIFDVTGKKVLSKQLLSDENIDVSALTPALYFYKIKDGKVLKKSGKIIKQ